MRRTRAPSNSSRYRHIPAQTRAWWEVHLPSEPSASHATEQLNTIVLSSTLPERTTFGIPSVTGCQKWQKPLKHPSVTLGTPSISVFAETTLTPLGRYTLALFDPR